jgi:hypothetical protein
MSVPEYKGRKARQAFCHLDPGIRPEFSTLKGFAATFKHLDGSSSLFLRRQYPEKLLGAP